MNKRLFIFIGGSDEDNGDYSRVQRLAVTGGTTTWSSLKGAKPGDRVLIYIRQPLSALFAEAEVLAAAVKSNSDDYAYRAKLGRFKLLPRPLDIQELKREFPGWAWLRFPRGKATVPTDYARRLWKLVHQKDTNLQILLSNSKVGKTQIEAMAETGRKAYWSTPKFTSPGDRVLFYVEGPVSAIVAQGEALTAARATNRRFYEARIGKVKLLPSPIPLSELRSMFPDWRWLRTIHMFAYVNQVRADALVTRAALEPPSSPTLIDAAVGGGFGDPETNKRVEQTAVSKVTRLLKKRGFKVKSRERHRCGYDLEATKPGIVLWVEVKGVSGSKIQFIITQGEVNLAKQSSSFRLMVVTNAVGKKSQIHEFLGSDLESRFTLKPISYIANLK